MPADPFSRRPPEGELPGGPDAALPVDPDLGGDSLARSGPRAGGSPFGRSPARRPRPRIDPRVLVAIAAGGFAGGLVRYLLAEEWSVHGSFPWPVFTVNTAGAFLLGLLLVLVLEVLPPTRYLRPALGTGFCGALTTFSSVVVTTDQLAAHGQAGLAAGYAVASAGAGLAAASLGMIAGRAFAAWWEQGQGQRQKQGQGQGHRQGRQG